MDAAIMFIKEALMRRTLILAIASMLLVTGPALAGTLDQIKESGTFRIGFRTDAAPFSYLNAIEEPSGYSVSLCHTIGLGLEASGWKN
jgi:polar amino acid transport system substrate-binding protein/glutamate/aspartate transport system substrate-binding protein